MERDINLKSTLIGQFVDYIGDSLGTVQPEKFHLRDHPGLQLTLSNPLDIVGRGDRCRLLISIYVQEDE